MRFTSPQWLALLAAVPLLVAGYAALLRRRRAGRWGPRPLAEPHLMPALAPRSPGWRRHVPVAALGLAACCGVLAAAGPAAAVDGRRALARLVVAIDVSGSMDATDVPPNRLGAARAAADAFVAGLPGHVDVGVVTFARSANVLLAPSPDREAARAALAELRTGPGTAIGDAVAAGVAALGDTSAGGTGTGGGDVPRRIVLLSDGASNAGQPVEQAARAAAAAGVAVDTIAFGTAAATGGGQADLPAMRELAEATGGRAYEAASAGELTEAYRQIGTQAVTERSTRPVADWFLGAALLAALGGVAVALPWFRRVPL